MRHLDFGRWVQPFPVVRCLALALVALTFSRGTAAAQDTITIDVFNNDFGDASSGTHIDPVINVGDTIRWVWVNGFHSTTSVAGIAESWNSGDQSPNFTFNHTFTQVGTFQYYCDIHGFDSGNGTAGGMHGSVIVQPVPEPALALLCTGLAGTFVYGFRNRRRLSAQLAGDIDSRTPTQDTPGGCATGSES